jgi:hypothetical protein
VGLVMVAEEWERWEGWKGRKTLLQLFLTSQQRSETQQVLP